MKGLPRFVTAWGSSDGTESEAHCAKDRADVLGESVDETAYVKRNHHCGLAARVFGAQPLRAGSFL